MKREGNLHYLNCMLTQLKYKIVLSKSNINICLVLALRVTLLFLCDTFKSGKQCLKLFFSWNL